MSSSTPELLSQTSVFRLKEGARLSDIDATLKDLSKSEGIAKSYWGPQVENPGLFVWVVDFHSALDRDNFILSAAYSTFSTTSAAQFFNLVPETPNLITKWVVPVSQVNEAMTAPITEVAFYTIGTGQASVAEAKKAVEEGLEWTLMAVKKFGKATGAAIGWVLNEEEVILTGIFGYDCLDDHMRWREHPEHANALKVFVDLEATGLSLRPDLRVWGIDAKTGYFHVEFQSD